MKKIRMGVIGLGQRGFCMMKTLASCKGAEIVAVSDKYADRTEKAADEIEKTYGKRPVVYADYHELLKDKTVEGVMISSSWDTHVQMALDSMNAGKITAFEVGGGYDIEDCWELVRTYERTKTPVMMLENCCYDKFELLATTLYRNGLLGEVVHCHGAYSHDIRDEIAGGNVNRHYRLINYEKRNCENYPTHELGPIARLLDVNRGNKLLTVSSVSSKAAGMQEFVLTEANPDKSLAGRKFLQGDIVSSTIRCSNGETITLTLDTTLPKYYSREFTVRGTKGLCVQEANMVLIEGREKFNDEFYPEKTIAKFLNNAESYNEYLPEIWENITPEDMEKGHGGMDYLMLESFVNAAINGEEMPIDIYDAALWMSITPLSEQSIAFGGTPVAIPDFTRGKWMTRTPKDVTELKTSNK